jgi:hypothetical protein
MSLRRRSGFANERLRDSDRRSVLKRGILFIYILIKGGRSTYLGSRVIMSLSRRSGFADRRSVLKRGIFIYLYTNKRGRSTYLGSGATS